MRGVLMCRVCLLASAFTAIGCSDREAWKAATHPAHGRVLIDGTAPKGLYVSLKPLGTPPDVKQSEPGGVVDENGGYRLTTYVAYDGAPAGSYAVTLIWPANSTDISSEDRLGGRFDSRDEAVTTVEIQAGENEIPEIVLTDVRVDKNR